MTETAKSILVFIADIMIYACSTVEIVYNNAVQVNFIIMLFKCEWSWRKYNHIWYRFDITSTIWVWCSCKRLYLWPAWLHKVTTYWGYLCHFEDVYGILKHIAGVFPVISLWKWLVVRCKWTCYYFSMETC
jgi:hypothetical protein